ncbi:MAG: 4-hydroxybenzoate octaprenyltransferase [Pseudomonadota bacterium]
MTDKSDPSENLPVPAGERVDHNIDRVHSSTSANDDVHARDRVSDAPSGSFVYRLLPPAIWPYAQLARWDRPIGWWLLLWPCWWSVALVGQWTQSLNVGHMFLYFVGAVAMRGAGCTYNDIVDRKLDVGVERTRSRPLPSGRLSVSEAVAFMVVQALVGFVVLVQFNLFAVVVGLCSLLVVAAYPFMKRITDWPQSVLGLAFSWGALMGFAAILGFLPPPAIALYLGCVAWTIGYDTIYALQDIEDDALMGVRSTARLFGDHVHIWIAGFYGLALTLFAVAVWLSGAPLPAWIGLLAAAGHMGWQIRQLDPGDPAQCLALFRSNSVTGWIVFIGFVWAIYA